MNLLIFKNEELSEGTVLVEGRRAEHLIKFIKVKQGEEIRVGEVDGGVGAAIVEDIYDGKVRLRILSLTAQKRGPAVDIILALPRPQALKKTLEVCATMAVRRLYLCGASRVEKSYFHSPLLKEENIERHLLLGMEQGAQTRKPAVKIFRRFEELDREVLSLGSWATKLLADPSGVLTIRDFFSIPDEKKIDSFVLAVGPEGGWREVEYESFRRHGFSFCRLSGRILRVEQAVCAGLSQLELFVA